MAPKRLKISALGLLPLAAFASVAAAQQQTNTIGDPQLKDFELPGVRTTPPAPTPTPAPGSTATPAPAPAQPAPPAATPAPARPAPAAEPPPRAAATPRPPTSRPAEERAAPQTETAPPLPSPEMVQEALPGPDPLPLPVAPPEATPVPAPAPDVAPAPVPAAETESSWLGYAVGAGALLLLIAGIVLLRRRRRAAEDALPEEIAPVAEPAPRRVPEAAPILPAKPAPPPPAAPPAAPAPMGDVVGIQMRPWIELEFRPARAAATETEANVQFDLILRNKGNAAARNIRIEVRMFNAGPDQEREIEGFYAEPIRERTPPGLPGLHPRGEVTLTSAVALPKNQVREIELQGRRLFIPTVAFNIVYDWGNGRSGQTSASYLVGREAETPSAKMGAFRLDLGPRLYRSVGQRPTRLARAL